MKNTILIISILATYWTGFAQFSDPSRSAKKSQHEYFVRENLIPADESLIEIRGKDTVLVSYYKFTNPGNNSYQEMTRVYKGTPYFRNGWYKGFFNNTNGKPVTFSMAYNVEKGLVYYVDTGENKTIEAYPDEFTIGKTRFKAFDKKGANPNHKKHYYEVLYEGKSQLLKQHICKYITLDFKNRSGYDVMTENTFEGMFSKATQYYLVVDNEFKKVERNDKFLKSFGERKAVIEQFMIEKKLVLDNENDLKEVLKYYDQLSMTKEL